MNYEEVVHFIENQSKFHSIEYLQNVMNILNFNVDPEKVIIVAGTNGKGTTCATLGTLLIDAGKNIGFFSSPHLIKTTERIKFNGIDISEHDFCNAFFTVKEKIEDHKLSHFEWLTFMAVYYFFEIKKVDYAIFEVGLGGTYDSTNIIPHKFCVITRLAMDHQEILGNSLKEIAKNKLGIVSKNNIVFHTRFDSEIKNLSIEYAKKYDAKFIEACDFSIDVDQSERYPKFFVCTPFGKFRMNLPGNRAAENSVLALTAFNYLSGNNANKYGKAIERVEWPGRMQLVKYKNRDIFLSGDHNPNGIQSLIDILKYYHFQKAHFVIGICKDKDHQKMLKMLFDLPYAKVYLTETTLKVLPINEYGENYIAKAKYATANQIDALDKAIENSSEDDLVIVTGSLYLVGKIYSHILS